MSRKAALGFRYLSLDEEFKVPTDRELVHVTESVATDAHIRDKQRKLEWWHRNKRRYNLRRRSAACSIEKRYKAAKSRALRRGWGWEFSQEEWERAWSEAPWILVPGSVTPSKPEGLVVPAFALRGSHAYHNTCMQRLDPSKPWSVTNYKFMFRGEELRPGNRWYREPLQEVARPSDEGYREAPKEPEELSKDDNG